MPELPEVERARKLIHDSCRGYKIKKAVTMEDKIVFTGGTDHKEFANEIEGRTIVSCERKGKTFWLNLSGKGKMPVMHFGMTGMIQLKGQEPTWYRRRPRENSDVWPPRFHKVVLELEPQKGSVSDEPRELAFLDGRRLGRLRLVEDPVIAHPPVSKLGFDPVLSHPSLDEFKTLLGKKKGTIKGVIMDQAFSAGVGNWVADEILYQARIHPACPVPHLSDDEVAELHRQIRAVPLKAVEVNADSKKFPEDWLFRWRWSKGKKQERGSKKAEPAEDDAELGNEDIKPKGKDFLPLPNGRPATITFIEVGGRTTAVVTELQKMPEGIEIKPKVTKGGPGSRGGKVGPPPKRQKKDGKGKKGGPDSDGESASVSSDASEEAEEGEWEGGDDSEAVASSGSDEVTTPSKNLTPRQKAALAKKNAANGVTIEKTRVKKEVKDDKATPKQTKTATPKSKSSTKRKSLTEVKAEEATSVKVEEAAAETPAKKPRTSRASVVTPQSGTSGRRRSTRGA